MTIGLRPVTEEDLPQIEAWLYEPHVARWWLTKTTVAEEIEDIRKAIRGEEALEVLVVELDGDAVGWCQWYRWWEWPKEAAEVGAHEDDLGLDYTIGVPSLVGRGVGTEMIAELIRYVRARVPDTGILVEPDAANPASRRILEKNGFELLDVRKLSFEAEALNAIYRLPPGS